MYASGFWTSSSGESTSTNLFIQNDPYPDEENSISQTGYSGAILPGIVQGYILEILHICSLK